MERARARRPARPEVRFDDCRASPARASRLTGLRRVIEAREPAEVPSALDELARAVRAGLWAGGFVTYEAAPAFDPAFEVATRGGPPSGSMPLLWFGLFERREGAPPLEPGDDTPADPGYRLSDWTPSIDRPAYEAAVERIRELIADGQTYQVNLTFKLQAAFEGDDLALYRDLCLAQRAADCAYVSTGRFRVLSASPELFFRLDGDRVTSRPMKGTCRRGRWVEEDREALAALLASSKDRAENAMIVDLIRNDLGKVSTTGTVEVPRLFDAERYETVWQLTSTVTSRLPGGAEPMNVLRALFPSGSVTGAPKVRTMRIIADLEHSPRGVYTGAVGFFAPPGSPGPRARFNVAIRTVALDALTGRAEYGVGGGVTWGSSPAGEYEECRAKAEVLTVRRPGFELLETLRFDPGPHGGFDLLHGHLERLRGSAAYFGFAFDEASVRRALERAAAAHPGAPLRVRLTLARSGAAVASAEPFRPSAEGPVRLVVHGEPVDPRDPFRYHKTTLRSPYRRAVEAHPAADDVVLVNAQGQAVETTIANVAVKRDGAWWTPPLGAGCLPGVRRTMLVADGTLAERAILVDELRRADALAVLSSVRGWRPAVLCPD